MFNFMLWQQMGWSVSGVFTDRKKLYPLKINLGMYCDDIPLHRTSFLCDPFAIPSELLIQSSRDTKMHSCVPPFLRLLMLFIVKTFVHKKGE